MDHIREKDDITSSFAVGVTQVTPKGRGWGGFLILNCHLTEDNSSTGLSYVHFLENIYQSWKFLTSVFLAEGFSWKCARSKMRSEQNALGAKCTRSEPDAIGAKCAWSKMPWEENALRALCAWSKMRLKQNAPGAKCWNKIIIIKLGIHEGFSMTRSWFFDGTS